MDMLTVPAPHDAAIKELRHEHCQRFIPRLRMCWTVYSVPAWESLAS
jgi:hypothetical protein